MTLVEFVHVMRYVYDAAAPETIFEWILKPMTPHASFEGNYRCRFHSEDGKCGVHPDRPMACRLHGLPVIEKLGVSNLENCTIMDKGFLPDLPVPRIREWLKELMDLNKEWDAQHCEGFYKIIGLNFECWLDILFVEDLSNELLRDLQALLREAIPHRQVPLDYKPHTEIAEKVETIALLQFIIESGDRGSVLALLDKLEKEFPTTGNYFHDEVKWMREQILQSSKEET